MSERSVRIAAAFAVQASVRGGGLCDACVHVLGVSGAGITLMGGTAAGPVCASDTRTSFMEDLQFTLGEGPCQDAFASRTVVAAPNIDVGTETRWPAFAQSAAGRGIGAVFAFPMRIERARIGVLTLYQDESGPLTDTQYDDAEMLAEVLTAATLDMVRDDTIAPALDDAVAHRAEVHQATGMVSAQLEVTPAVALARIRAHAYSQDRPVGDVAADIVARRLRLSHHLGDQGGAEQ